MSHWKEEPWAVDPLFLVADLEALYTKAIQAGRMASPEVFTAGKVRHYRGWHSSVPDADITRAVGELEAVYVPPGHGPGPGLCFPIRDMTREVMRLHIRLLEDRPAFYKMNYMSLVDPERFLGPAWIGADDATLEAIIRSGEVIIVEGPADLLAVRTLACPVPSICPTNKRLTDDHWDFLRVFGVKRVLPLLDNEQSGVGNRATRALFNNPHRIEVNPLVCPVKDPSAALTRPLWISMLKRTFSQLRPKPISLEEEI